MADTNIKSKKILKTEVAKIDKAVIYQAKNAEVGEKRNMQKMNIANSNKHKNDPLHGKTLKVILEEMVALYGWEVMANRVDIKCFSKDPSIKSSLTFLRKYEWAREKVEELYVMGIRGINK